MDYFSKVYFLSDDKQKELLDNALDDEELLNIYYYVSLKVRDEFILNDPRFMNIYKKLDLYELIYYHVRFNPDFLIGEEFFNYLLTFDLERLRSILNMLSVNNNTIKLENKFEKIFKNILNSYNKKDDSIDRSILCDDEYKTSDIVDMLVVD